MTASPSTASGGPDFLVIGAQRSATSWLDRCLRLQPGMWIPPLKELHYFDRSEEYGASPDEAFGPWWQALRGPRSARRAWRWHVSRNLRAVVERAQSPWQVASHVAWWLQYQFSLRRDDDWYRSLFNRGAGRIRGEITPAYAVLGEESVRRIAMTFPRLRIVLLIRDPIERSVSQFHMHCDYRLLGAAPQAAAVRDFLLGPAVRERNDYLRMIDTWAGCFGADRFLLGWYDDIVSSPSRVLNAILDFLDVPPAGRAETKLPSVVFASSSRQTVPQEALAALAEAERPRIAAMAERLGRHAHGWLARCDDIMRR